MVIFVAGVHGSGKSSFCQKVANDYPGFLTHASASKLIAEQKKQTNWYPKKSTPEISENQLHLIKALNDLKSRAKNILLDGHFTLLNEFNEIKEIDHTVLGNLNISVCILLEAEPDEIRKRIELRDEETWSIEAISRHLSAEKKQAENFCKEYNKKLFILKNKNYDDFRKIIVSIIKDE